jgi:SpoVK/Ycf46/Vps4 family AAA+-type ATPase
MSGNIIATDTGVLNAQVFYKQLDRLMGASIGVIAIRTREMERAKTLLHEWSSMRSLDFHVWNRLRGFDKFKALPIIEAEGGDNPVVSVDPDKISDYLTPSETLPQSEPLISALDLYPLRVADKLTARNRFCGVFLALTNDELLDPMVQQHFRDHVQRAYDCDDRIILLLPAQAQIPDDMAGEIEVIDLSPPSFAELTETLNDLGDTIAEALDGFELGEDDQAKIVQNSLGMTLQEFENAVSLAIVDIADAVRVDPKYEVTVDGFVNVIRMRKLEILKKTEILELLPEAPMNSIGGFDLLKASLQREVRAFLPEARAYGIELPKGFVAVGPPGSGKSLLCKAVSAALGLPAIMFNISAVFNALVGSSEQRLRMCLQMLEDMAPCIAFIDEIDKAMSGGDNDGGVSKRILGILLTWMQEKSTRGKMVYVIASANDVSNFPPELIRKGRFDNIWGMGFPSHQERIDIFKIHVEKRGHKLTASEYTKLAKATENYVGAEIESIVTQALLEDFFEEHDGLTFDMVKRYAEMTTPQSKAFPARIQAMKDWIDTNAKPASSTGVLVADDEVVDETTLKPAIRTIKRKPRVNRSREN